MVITFEGLDTAGKSALMEGVVLSAPYKYVTLRDVGVDELIKSGDIFSKFGIDVRSPDTLQLLYCAIVLSTEVEIENVLREGKVPLVDRYIDTLVVYASLFTHYRRPVTVHRQIAELLAKYCNPRPDVTFYLDVDYATVVQRLRERQDLGMLERFSPDTFQEIKSGFFHLMGTTDRRFVIVPKGLSLNQAIHFCIAVIADLERPSQ